MGSGWVRLGWAEGLVRVKIGVVRLSWSGLDVLG